MSHLSRNKLARLVRDLENTCYASVVIKWHDYAMLLKRVMCYERHYGQRVDFLWEPLRYLRSVDRIGPSPKGMNRGYWSVRSK